MSPEIERLAELLRDARHALVLTGAGVSTESGLPDYRGSDGLWRNRRFEELAHIETWRREPEAFWAFYRERLDVLARAQPNDGHRAIAELERRGFVARVLTQNVDGLHRAAGSDPLELHGTLAEVECLACGFRGPTELAAAQLANGADVPALPHLRRAAEAGRHALRRAAPARPRRGRARARALRSPPLLRLDSAGVPGRRLPPRCTRRGGEVAIVNLGPTGADHLAEVRLDARTGEALPALVAALVAPARLTFR